MRLPNSLTRWCDPFSAAILPSSTSISPPEAASFMNRSSPLGSLPLLSLRLSPAFVLSLAANAKSLENMKAAAIINAEALAKRIMGSPPFNYCGPKLSKAYATELGKSSRTCPRFSIRITFHVEDHARSS
jgi:hypothetical protein